MILACNTASAAALRRMQEGWVPQGKRVLGVFVPLIEALTERRWGDNSPPREVAVNCVALFATPATVRSRAFQRELSFRAVGVDVEAQACGGLVDAIEEGDMILAEALVRSPMSRRSSARCRIRRRRCSAAPITRCCRRPSSPRRWGRMCRSSARRTSWPRASRITSSAIPADGGRRCVEVPHDRRSAQGLGAGDAVPPTPDPLREGLTADAFRPTGARHGPARRLALRPP